LFFIDCKFVYYSCLPSTHISISQNSKKYFPLEENLKNFPIKNFNPLQINHLNNFTLPKVFSKRKSPYFFQISKSPILKNLPELRSESEISFRRHKNIELPLLFQTKKAKSYQQQPLSDFLFSLT